MNRSKIEWCDVTWNPITGCTNGCKYCYARRMAQRLRGRAGYPADDPFRPTLHPDRLEEPLRRRNPAKIFACSMGDLFGPNVPDEQRDRVFAGMGLAPQHTFMVLTKRADRARQYMADPELLYWALSDAEEYRTADDYQDGGDKDDDWSAAEVRRAQLYEPGVENVENSLLRGFPLPNVWLGVSCEDQAAADERIPHLLATPAAVRFVSVEPLLGPVDLTRVAHGKDCLDVLGGTCVFPTECPEFPKQGCSMRPLNWVIVGAQTGPGAVKPDPAWVQSLVDQCRAAGVPLFLKDNLNWPEVAREYPEVANDA